MGFVVVIAGVVVIGIIVMLILITVKPEIFEKKNGKQSPEVKKQVDKSTDILIGGSRNQIQQLATDSITYPSEYELKVENNYLKGFVVSGYPAQVSVGWMDAMYSYKGDMDVAIYIEPENQRNALDELTAKITQYESQYLAELDSGSIKNLTDLTNKIKILTQQRAELEQNFEKLFHVSTLGVMYRENREELEKDAQRFQAKLSSSIMNLMQLDMRHDEAFKSCAPFGLLSIPDYQRNLNTGALSTMFPFYNCDLCDQQGTLIGLNTILNTPIFLDLFNRELLMNLNICIMGGSGAGKTYFTSTLIIRSVIEGVMHCIIDPENEYGACCNACGGVTVRIAPDSDSRINPFDLDEEAEIDKNGRPTGKKIVNLKNKVLELLNLFKVMFPGGIDSVLKSELSDILLNMYQDFGFTKDVESLYTNETKFNSETGQYLRDKIYKPMPSMSIFRECVKRRYDEIGLYQLGVFYQSLKIYCKGGVLDLFDGQSSFSFSEFENCPILRFDVSGIEEDELRPLSMYMIFSWIMNKFIKKDIKTKKRLVCDETWMLLSPQFAGSEYTAQALQNCARRIRKYNGSLCCPSQHFQEFVGRPEGQAILSNSAVKIFMKQQPEDIASLGDRFILSDGEKSFLLAAHRGEMLIKVANQSVKAEAFAFPFEHELISREEQMSA